MNCAESGLRLKSSLARLCAASIMLAVGVLSCATDQPVERAGGARAKRQRVHSTELLNAMRDIDQQTHSQFAADIASGSPSREDFRIMGDAAAAVARIAPTIPGRIPQGDLSEQDRSQFAALAGQLRDQAIQLQKAAESNDTQMLRINRSKLQATCNECHDVFRAGR